MRVFDLPSGAERTVLEIHAEFVRSVVFDPTGSLLACGPEAEVKLVDLSALADPACRIAQIEQRSFFSYSGDDGRLHPRPAAETPPPRLRVVAVTGRPLAPRRRRRRPRRSR
ncbi:MAG: hypothetical protein HY815_16210 [Candidatus Riflebacteria bacterium]|nr:hypothetical protein [Candidatus Riflebacteria bacterium]